jgi:hypothetical protein
MFIHLNGILPNPLRPRRCCRSRANRRAPASFAVKTGLSRAAECAAIASRVACGCFPQSRHKTRHVKFVKKTLPQRCGSHWRWSFGVGNFCVGDWSTERQRQNSAIYTVTRLDRESTQRSRYPFCAAGCSCGGRKYFATGRASRRSCGPLPDRDRSDTGRGTGDTR